MRVEINLNFSMYKYGLKNLYQKRIRDYIVHKLHSKFRIQFVI